MVRKLQLLVLLLTPALALAADDARVTRLEQDVRTLQRDLQNLSRLVEQLRMQNTRPTSDGQLPPPSPPIDSGPAWLDAGKWKKLHPGMAELDVIGTLGPPTSTRESNGTRELLYAMEIGTTAFLGGSVRLRDRVVVEVQVPTLK